MYCPDTDPDTDPDPDINLELTHFCLEECYFIIPKFNFYFELLLSYVFGSSTEYL